MATRTRNPLTPLFQRGNRRASPLEKGGGGIFETFVQYSEHEEEKDTVKSGLPVSEFVHPATLIAMAVMALNDHVLKGSGFLPGWLTGKLSDVVGMIFFPLFLTALVDTLLFFLFKASCLAGLQIPVSYQLSRTKLILSCLFTGGCFSALQLSSEFAAFYVACHEAIGFSSYVTQDPTDIFAIVFLPVAYFIGRAVLSVQNESTHEACPYV